MKPPKIRFPKMTPKTAPMTLDKAIHQTESMPMDMHQAHIPTVSAPFKHPDDQHRKG